MITRSLLILITVSLGACAGNKLVKVVDRVESGISEDGLSVSTRRVRAWVEDIERDVAAATLVTRLDEEQSISGLAIDEGNNRVVFALIEKQANQGSGQQVNTVLGKYSSTLRGVPTRGGGISQLTTGRWLDTQPSYGPVGAITFASNRTRPDGLDIFRVNASRAGGVSVIRQTVEGYSYSPSVDAEGKMVFTHLPDYRRRGISHSDTQPQLWSIGGGNPYPTQLREGSDPALSPDGKTIAFTGVNGQLWTIDVEGTNPVQLTTTPIPLDKYSKQPMRKVNATWSPDGTHIVYAAADGKDGDNISNYDIWIIPRDGGNARQLTTNGSLDVLPIISPNSNDIYFVSNRGFVEGIWKIPYPATSLQGYRLQ